MTEIFPERWDKDLRLSQSFDWFNREVIRKQNNLEFSPEPIANNWIDDLRITSFVRPIQLLRRMPDVEVLERQRAEMRGLKVDIQPIEVINDLRNTMFTVKKKKFDVFLNKWIDITDPFSGEFIEEQRSLLDIIKGNNLDHLREVAIFSIRTIRAAIQNNTEGTINANILGAIMRAYLQSLAQRNAEVQRRDANILSQGFRALGSINPELAQQIMGAVRAGPITYQEMINSNMLQSLVDVFKDLPEAQGDARFALFLELWQNRPEMKFAILGATPDQLMQQIGRQPARISQNKFRSEIEIQNFYKIEIGLTNVDMINILARNTKRVNDSVINKNFMGGVRESIAKDVFEVAETITKQNVLRSNKTLHQLLSDIYGREGFGAGDNVTEDKLMLIYREILSKAKDEENRIISGKIKGVELKEPEDLIPSVNRILEDYTQNVLLLVRSGTFIDKIVYDKLFNESSKTYDSNFTPYDKSNFVEIMDEIQEHSVPGFINERGFKFETLNLIRDIGKGNKVLVFISSDEAELIKTREFNKKRKNIYRSYVEFGIGRF